MMSFTPYSSLRSPARRLLLALLAASTFACASSAPQAPVSVSAPVPNPYRVQVPNPQEVPRLLADFAKGRYLEEVNAVYAEAGAILAQVASQGEKNAVVLDIDETSLSNLRFYELNHYLPSPSEGPCNLEVGPCSVHEWFSRPLASPIESAVAFVRQAQSLGVAVFFITGRKEETRAATEKNLRDAGYANWQELVLRPNGPSQGGAADYKAPQRRRISEEGYRILINIGDQESDLAGGYAEKTFKLPNPFYFIP